MQIISSPAVDGFFEEMIYMHFWANDDAGKLPEGPRAALDQTNSQK
jgi:hypothetical protein